jgi:hypothetical protein
MGIRAIVRDILGIYLGFEIIRGATTGDFVFHIGIIISAILLFIFGIWFLLERIGLLPKIT